MPNGRQLNPGSAAEETSYDLIVVGAGSGNMLLSPELAGLRTAIIEADRFGGTCLNRGCIPSKMYVRAADAARDIATAGRLGVHGNVDRVDWPAIRDRIFGRIDPMHDQAVQARRDAGIDVFLGPVRFVGPRTLMVESRTLTAEHVVVATGSRPIVPDIPGLGSVPFHTSDTIMRLAELPDSMVIIGGGFIAAEFAHVFASFGTTVTVIAREPTLLSAEDADVAKRFTDMNLDRFGVHLGVAVRQVRATPTGVRVSIDGPAGEAEVYADLLLIATGREPAVDQLDAELAGVTLDDHGRIAVDAFFRTSASGVWAFGDVASEFQLKHLANAQMEVVAHNLLHPDDLRSLETRLAPHAVFSDPQIASVGLTEAQANDSDRDCIVAIQAYSETAYGWALEDTTSFVKLIGDRQTRRILGAHILGPEAALLLQPLVQAMMLDLSIDQLARDVIYIHPALCEVVAQALLKL